MRPRDYSRANGIPASDFAAGQQTKQVPESSASQFAPRLMKGEFPEACNP